MKLGARRMKYVVEVKKESLRVKYLSGNGRADIYWWKELQSTPAYLPYVPRTTTNPWLEK
jgi:hypothetical protein